uniref:NAD(+) diphosphatase n=1 Tax=Thaumasiovibrio occultus TaxID=1891184 RepID=UPI000B35BB9D|nr:NAD(+) diphosphatase [Thaumasiovibrio occultus]
MSQFEIDSQNAYWCVIHDRDIALVDQNLPYGKADACGVDASKAIQVGEYQQAPVYWVSSSVVPNNAVFQPLRALLHEDAALFNLASRAMQLDIMRQTQGYCSICGTQTEFSQDLMAMVCGSCNQWHYPRISPCIIVAVRREGKILLAQHPRHRNGMYTVIAGFVEAGETLEQCVVREVKEETGVDVGNVRYVGSQPWAFPSNLMMAFMADYVSGDLKPDYNELTDARWCDESDLPVLPPPGTIARRLIEDSLAEFRQDV